MIWFNVKELKKRLVNESLTDKECLSYLIASLIITTIAHISNVQDKSNLLNIMEVILWIFITVLLLKRTFDINVKGDNKEYSKRFISLSFVTKIRLFVYLVVVIFHWAQ